VRLTEVGAAVIPYARAAIIAAAGARLAVDELSGLLRGHVAMGMVTLSSFAELPDLLAAFNHEHPAVEITLTEANSDRLLEAIQTGELDLALIGLSSTPPAGIATQLVTDQALVAAVGHGDPLARRKTITLRALGQRKLISLPLGTGMRNCLDEACTAAGLRPHIAFEASDPVTLAQLASRGLGVAILPKAFAETQHLPLHAISIIGPPLRSRLELAWRADGPISPAARALITHARNALGARHAPT
jgi:DNA-binding transcriptional LysR family regulator